MIHHAGQQFFRNDPYSARGHLVGRQRRHLRPRGLRLGRRPAAGPRPQRAGDLRACTSARSS
ncbi:MAG: hypothetical protein MZW92_23120 [Comamonadaceae bacterium]|nr:hypothetical protein [Comamonadaceae bacterium]